jgi:phage gp29-like protein
MTIPKQTKEYVITLTQHALKALRRNEFESAEDYLNSAYGELHDANLVSI